MPYYHTTIPPYQAYNKKEKGCFLDDYTYYLKLADPLIENYNTNTIILASCTITLVVILNIKDSLDSTLANLYTRLDLKKVQIPG